MKTMPKVPWDLAVFLTITTVGFGYSVQRVAHRELQTSSRSRSAWEEPSLTEASGGRQSFDLGCLEQKSSHRHLTSDQGSIRLRGKFCRFSRRDMKTFDGVQVKNLTNGFEGTIFFQGYDASFVTDAVTLEPGRNLIQLEWRETSNSPARVYTAEIMQR